MAAVDAAGRATGLEPLEALEDARAGELYERHSRRVFAYCRSRLGRREDAEDAVQTTFLHAVRGLRNGVEPSVELAWLLGIARNVCLTRIESAGRRGRLELVCDPVDLERSEAPRGRSEELIGLEDALGRLPEQQRRAVLLRDWRGLSYEEVAAQLGVSLANAETLIFRGRRALAALLQEEPVRTRRRLASLGDAGSLLTWAKASIGGAAAASKLAAAVAVVVVSGAGVAAGTGTLGSDPPSALPVTSATAQPVADRRVVEPRDSTGRERRTSSVPLESAATTRRDSTAPGARSRPSETASQTSPPAAAVPTPAPAPEEPRGTASQGGAAPPTSKPRPTPVAATVSGTTASAVEGVADTVEQVVPALAPVLDPVTDTVVEVVEALPVPALPVETPPVVETVVESLPPVTVTPPAPLPIGPITVAPAKLLP